MKKIKAYGFVVKDKKGLGFVRWFNSNTVKITGKNKTLPFKINHIYLAQNNIDFHAAYNYCKDAAKRYKLQFITLTEQDWKAIKHPVKKFFKQLLKRK